MAPGDAVTAVLRDYPRIYLACHRRHVADPRTRAVLSSHQASVLDHLDTIEPTTVSSLAAHMGVTPSTMSLTLDRLEKGGYVRRIPDRQDARRVGVVVTAAGERIKRANSVLDPALLDRLVRELSPEERRRAIEGLALLAEAAERAASARLAREDRHAVAAPRGGK